jgi:transposase
VDFGEVTRLVDPASGELRRTWAFSLVLGWSRHMYVELVFDQQVPTWLTCHQHAFEFFGGVPWRLVIDNLKPAILRAYAQEREAQVQRAYGECAEHYGFLIDPCLPAKPQHKGKVERSGVGYVCHKIARCNSRRRWPKSWRQTFRCSVLLSRSHTLSSGFRSSA